MTHARRDFLRHAAAASLAGSAAAAVAVERIADSTGATKPAAPPAPSKAEAGHDMHPMPPHWTGKEQIAMLLYPGFTALDLVGPHYMLSSLMGARVHLVAATREPVRSDASLQFVPDMTMAELSADVSGELDVLFVPGGGEGTLQAMKDAVLIAWLAEQARRAKLLASVCTGSMIMGQAGLLRGKRATSHWATHALLRDFGAIPVDRRVVWDGRVVTGAGVSAGLDLGLAIVARLRDETYAQSVQLLAEYAPQPPFDAGTPKTAPAAVHRMMGDMFDPLRERMRETARSALGA